METRKNFQERMKTNKLENPTTKMFTVLIVDDVAQQIKKEIEEKLECQVLTYDIQRMDEMLKKGTLDSFQKFDAMLFDASYYDKELEMYAIDALEKLIEIDPQYRNISKVLLGSDIVEYAKHDDFKTNWLIYRVKKLPYAEYGKNGTKLEHSMWHIQNVAKKQGKEIPVKLPKGVCRPELIEKIKPYINQISENAKKQYQSASQIEEMIKEFKPENEGERRILEIIPELRMSLLNSSHLIMNYCFILQNRMRLSENLAKEEQTSEQGDNQTALEEQ